MSIPKEPRQQMINIMYLVLTALLALNVSAEILNAFRLLKRGIDSSNMSIADKINNTMMSFEAKVKKENRGQEYLAAAGEARKLSAEFGAYIDGLDTKLMTAVGVDTAKNDLKRADDQDTPTRLFVEEEKLGYELQEKVGQYREKFVNLFKDKVDRDAINATLPLQIDMDTAAMLKSGKKDWPTYTFYQMPAQAVRTLLSKFKNDGVSSEAAVVDKLFSKVGEVTILYDKFKAAVIPNSTYLIQGETFEADIYLAASSSMARPVITVGGSTLPLDADGMAKYKATASGVGEQTISGTVSTVTSTGERKTYPFTQKYTVATRADLVLTVSPDKMNVFYIGVDNPVTVAVSGVRDDKLRASMTGGTLTKASGPGKYTVRVSAPGEANISVTAETKEGAKTLGPYKFRVKRIPDPRPEVGGKPGGKMGTGEWKAQGGVIAKLYDFDFDARFDVLGFEMTLSEKGQDLKTCTNGGPSFTGQCAALVSQAKVGSIYYLDNIKAKGPDGSVRTLPTISFQIR